MSRKNKYIPENTLPAGTREGIFITRTSVNGSPNFKEVERAHRDNGHLFILQEKGTTHIEIDFQIHHIGASSLIYIHPSQIHRLLAFENATTTSWIITSENLHQEYLKLLENLQPVSALALAAESAAVIAEAASLCIRLCERKHERLFEYILKESFNTLIALAISQFLDAADSADNQSRFEVINKAFRTLLEHNFKAVKSPGAYAEKLNVSAPYLNECVRNTTGHPVSYHIQQRVILEIKRLLFHTTRSIKEIAAEMGYDDYSYFTRLFVKVTGISPTVFRSRNLD